MAVASPIDYAQTRKTLVQALCSMTGLGPNCVIRAQGQGPIQPRPALPYLSFKYRTAAMRDGLDALVQPVAQDSTLWQYVGARGIAMDLMAYGQDQDQAYGLALCVQSGLQQEPYLDILQQSGLSVWTIGDVTDMTTLLNTGFEGRALLECELWQGVNQLVDLGQMDTVSVNGHIQDDTGHTHDCSITATLG